MTKPQLANMNAQVLRWMAYLIALGHVAKAKEQR